MQVVKFCEHYIEEAMVDIERPLRSENMADVVSRWYADFVSLGDGEGQMSQEMLFELILVRGRSRVLEVKANHYSSGCKLFGYQAFDGFDLRKGCFVDQEQNTRANS